MANLDLAGIITRVCTDLMEKLRARFSKVAVTKLLYSGTSIASIAVDGTYYTLYAPTPPSRSTTTPLMDGVASVGNLNTYALADHVHPTDTSRQATLVSGTNIKTINGNSLLGSGDLTISSGSGGGVSYTTQTVTLTVSGWDGPGLDNKYQTVSVTGVTASNDVIVAPAPSIANVNLWASAGVICTQQGAGTLTFGCNVTPPTSSLTANVIVLEGGVKLINGGGSN